jgi:putative FmdB family regulatory protein
MAPGTSPGVSFAIAVHELCYGATISPKNVGGPPMPHYEYHCEKCNLDFEKLLTLKEHETEQITCPKCGSTEIVQLAAAFFAVTSKKS